MATDPYYWSRDINAIQNQRQAVGQARSFSPEEISNIIGANFRAQQEFGEREREFEFRKKAQEESQALSERAQTFNEINAIEQRKIQKSQQKTQAITGATSLAINAPIAYAAAKSAGLWGPSLPPALTSTATTAGTTQSAVTGAGASTGTTAAGTGIGTAAAGAGGVALLAGDIYYTGKAAERAGLSETTGRATAAIAPIYTAPIAAWEWAREAIFDGSIICTELNRQGFIPDSMIRASSAYVLKHGDKEAYIGYLIFATPIVKVMKKSKLITWIMKPYGEIMCRECSSRTNPKKYKSTVISRLAYKISEKVFKMIYRNSVTQEVIYG